jgi:lipoprotein-releasing system ATP-binding protein
MAELLVDNVAKEYPTRGEPLQVLRGVSLELGRGQNLAILGPSGSGKRPPAAGGCCLAARTPPS